MENLFFFYFTFQCSGGKWYLKERLMIKFSDTPLISLHPTSFVSKTFAANKQIKLFCYLRIIRSKLNITFLSFLHFCTLPLVQGTSFC